MRMIVAQEPCLFLAGGGGGALLKHEWVNLCILITQSTKMTKQISKYPEKLKKLLKYFADFYHIQF